MSTVLNCTPLTSSSSPSKPGLIGGNAPRLTLINVLTNQKSKLERFQALEVKASSDGAKTTTTNKSLVCESCEGNGKIVCKQCEGTGVNTEDHFGGRFKAGGLCWLCRGKKEILCGGCNGAGYAGGFMSTADE
ncbi:putative Heat shock protein DnaJ, cysteine-rich domain superfamily [Helianthus annuus]|uniref:Heat shock protein DnaJ, cysteine-rich domain superfamily n=1 Tax=Helianthus annuus TaxID=4232 RepID=A0A251TSW2_HELAN|nr:protein BUNDLE SHEATH DEFECTIVE 2, chloroplastic [Helianthus annuus]KAF5789117.1 putative Heat shock protein DnaJ, cysteine-rich domain superfamily [Helianthus annuus]KAJ0532327.1 putative Heat shock protein DnaJ, cysteine-rich domain superfamily [Helianthus annuus]KAJ0540865.1 putative Heat shock protein DnaJ, cysteine-rich domain superfamily [Helianthus annuus]KAJ0705965.1 putative Heat shock protein DnaJ, cysteine-rich domain superfamily [Helianthus annuus]KAJ0710085.1 putative Heat shoc